MKKLVFALCALVAVVSMSSCTADSVDENNSNTNASPTNTISPQSIDIIIAPR